MKKFGKLLIAALAAGLVATSCSGTTKKPELSLWVGAESVEFYKKAVATFEKETNFPYKVVVVASDAGTVAGSMAGDNTACGDIVTVAHDNIGKLAQKQLIRGINDAELLAQIEADNPQTYKDVIKSTYGKSGEKYVFGVPYISQALFLMYNKRYISAEQAQSFEGIKQAVDAANTANPNLNASGVTVADDGAYNFSFTILARTNDTKETTLKLYENLVKTETYAQGDDMLANLRWANEAYQNKTFTFPNSSGFATMMNTGSVLAMIGGTWHYSAVASAIGEENIGLAKIPTWTLEARHVLNTEIQAGTVMRGGTFADCKVFIINGAMDQSKYPSAQKLLKYLSTKEVQKQSYLEANNVPAFEGYEDYIESIKDQISENQYLLGKLQAQMGEYGIAQPFVTATLNSYYYSSGANGIYNTAMKKAASEFASEEAKEREFREGLWNIEYLWKWGDNTNAEVPDVLPGSTDKQEH